MSVDRGLSFGFYLAIIAATTVIVIGTYAAADKCNEHGDRFIRAEPAGVLCKRPDGTVVVR